MAKIVDRDEVQRLIKSGVQLIDVLPPKEFSAGHLPGAINISLPNLSGATGRLQSQQPTVVYCYDLQ